MDRTLVSHFTAIRKKITAASIKDAISSHCNAGFAAALSHNFNIKPDSEVEMEGVSELVVPLSVKPFTIEADLLVGLMVIARLVDSRHLHNARAVAQHLADRVKNVKTGFDSTIGKIYFYIFRVHELSGAVSEVRPTLLEAFRSATVHHSPTKQAVLINLILRSYFLQGLVDQASKFVSKVNFPETRSNAEFARYLFYLGVIKAIQLEYSESHSCLMQAIRKAPQGCALGFRLAATKASVIVELLMGEIPDRSVFNEFKNPMRTYLTITEAVRKGDVVAFTQILKDNEALFVKDRVWSLVRRLHQNVIKAGLRGIATTYSRISLSDVAKKLSLATVEEAADVSAKAIVDGVIDAHINYEKGWLESSWGEDVYSTTEPAKQLHKRIAYCLQLHTDAVKAMMYPDVNEIEKELMETNEEILKAQKVDLQDLEDDDDDLMM
jgi:26S proteasome regulatory subunit N3